MKKRKMIRDFTDLEIYTLALDLAALIYKLTNKFPDKEKFGITNQLRRASSSVGANIAEGFGRYHRKDFTKFLYNARGSLNETKHFLLLSKELKYIKNPELSKFDYNIKNLGIKINNLIKSINQTINR